MEPSESATERSADLEKYKDLYESAPVAYLTIDRRGRILDANETAGRLLRRQKADLIHQPLALYVAAEDRPVFYRHLRETVMGLRPRSCQIRFEIELGVFLFMGRLDSCVTWEPSHGGWRGGVWRGGERVCRTVISDATQRWREEVERMSRLRHEQELRAEKDAAQRRFDEIVAASAVLAESLDFAATISGAARIAVPHLASFCAVDLVDARGDVRRVATAREDSMAEDLPIDPYAPRGSARVIRTGRAELIERATPGDVLGLIADPERLWSFRALIGAYLCIPLRAHGRTLGAISFVRSRGPAYGPEKAAHDAVGFTPSWGPTYSPEEVALAEEIARHAALAIDNARLYREAQEADQRKDEFLALLGHELRNPLAAVVFAAARLRHHAASNPAALRAAEVVERQSSRLVRLVDDLLDVSRITRGTMALRRERIALADVIARAVESARPLVEARAHELSVMQPIEPVILDADAARLEQVVVNLLANAAKYTDPGGRIELHVAREARDVLLSVRDTGIGIAKEMLGQIFAPFTQINPSADRVGAGLGIGLTLARRLVEMHGGRISAHSAGLGKGSEFVVHLPLAEGEAACSPAPAPEAQDGPVVVSQAGAQAARRRVLVVDDDPDVAEMARDQLSALGHDVRMADSGAKAIPVALDFLPEVLFIDIGLPGMTGSELARRLRAEHALAGARMIALTGHGGPEIRRQCLEAGFDQHLTKPISREALERLLGAS